MLAQNISFGVLAAASILAALRVVTTKNVVHAAIYLVIVLGSVGALYVLLLAEFVAVVQVLVYIGAIIVLFLFGVMLTRTTVGRDPSLDNDQRIVSAVVALFLLGVMSFALIDAFDDQELPDLSGESEQAVVAARGTRAVADSIFSDFLVPFEVVSVLLLAALVGAIVLARRD